MDPTPPIPPTTPAPDALSRRGFLGRAALAAGAGLAAGSIPASVQAQQPRPISAVPLGPAFTPVAQVPKALAQHIVYGDCSLCVLGDSICTDGSSASNIPYGIQRTWKPNRWVGRTGRIYQGPPSWALSHVYNTFYYSEATEGSVHYRTPGFNYGGGEIAISPNTGYDWLFGNIDVPDNDPYLGEITPNDLANYTGGAWADNVPIRARLIYWRGGPHMVPALRMRGKRGPAYLDPVTLTMQGTPGIAYTDVSCGASLGPPGVFITSEPGVDERGKRAYPLGVGFWRHDGNGNRIPGFSLSQVGESGWNSGDHLAGWRCSAGNLAAFLAASLRPNTFLVHLANQTVPEMSALNAGSSAVYADSMRNMISRYTTAAIAAGAATPIRWILVNSFPVGAPEINNLKRAEAMYRVCQEDPANRAFIDLCRLAADRIGSNVTWYTTDGVHPNPAGAAYIAALIWAQIAAAV
jgi:lysophospholipase L1-like esterase